MANEKPGDELIFDPPNGKGYGESHKGSEMTGEMTALDLQPGMHVIFVGVDADNKQYRLIDWTDTTGIGRTTTVTDNDLWNSSFKPVK